jgi:polysaccharide biosynthesis protein PslH
MTGEILFIGHRIPFPPDRGDKIRSHHVLRHLASIAPVHVATFADDSADFAEEPALAAISASYRLTRRRKPLVVAGVQALAAREPVSLTAFRDASITAYIDEVLRTRPISAIYVFSGQMGQYVPKCFRGHIIADFCDVDSAKFEAYAARKGSMAGWVDAREGRMLRNEEARLSARADVSLLITGNEADLFASRLTPRELRRANIKVLGNGIDSDYFDPAAVDPEPRLKPLRGPKLIFTGQMDYAPNADAAIRAIDRIMPLIRKSIPDATFHVVGRKPTDALASRHGRNGCHVWGRVEDMRTWLKSADLALVPLEIARGVQNKVLEAMAMELPVVMTPGAATGIGGHESEHFRIAQSDEALARASIELLTDRKRAGAMGKAARRFVVEQVSWHAAMAPLDRILAAPARALRDAA